MCYSKYLNRPHTFPDIASLSTFSLVDLLTTFISQHLEWFGCFFLLIYFPCRTVNHLRLSACTRVLAALCIVNFLIGYINSFTLTPNNILFPCRTFAYLHELYQQVHEPWGSLVVNILFFLPHPYNFTDIASSSSLSLYYTKPYSFTSK